MKRQELTERILEMLRERPAGALELAAELDASPQLVLDVLKDLAAEGRVVEVPLGSVYLPRV